MPPSVNDREITGRKSPPLSGNRLQQERPRRSHLKRHPRPALNAILLLRRPVGARLQSPLRGQACGLTISALPRFVLRNGAGIVTRPRVENFTR